MYHRVVEDNTELYFNSYNKAGVAISLTEFTKQIRSLQKNYSITHLKDIVRCLEKRKILPPNACALSFDDGYQDHYQNVFPVLKRLKIPATFFIVGDCIAGNGRVRWLDKYYYILDNSPFRKNNIELQNKLSGFYHELNKKHKDKFKLEFLKEFIRNSPNKEKNEIINDLAKVLQTKIDLHNLNESLYLSEKNILEMMSCGMDIGAHSMTHPDLGQLNFEETKHEIIESGNVIRTITNKEEVAFAYPFGGPKTYNKEMIEVLRANNFLCACTSIPGLNTDSTSLFELKRIAGEKF